MSEVLFYHGLPLLLQAPKIDQRVGLYVLGWQTDQFLLTNLPYLNEKPLNLYKDDACIIRFLKDEDAYGLQTSIISVQFFPTPLIFFKYPTSVDKMPFRKSKRFRLNIPSKLLNSATMKSMETEISDISLTGCLLRVAEMSEDDFNIGERCYLTFHILDKGVEVDCILRNARQSDGAVFVGMEFVSLSNANRDTIGSFIDMLTHAVG